MIEIEPRRPKILARKSIDLCARRAGRKHEPGNRDMPFQHARESITHLARRRTNRDRAGDVRRTVFVLGAGIYQKEAATDPGIARARHAVMRTCRVRSERGDRWKGDVAQFAGFLAESFER